MRKTTAAAWLGLCLLLASPAWTAAQPVMGIPGEDHATDSRHGGRGHGHGHFGRQPDLDWSAYPADIQVYQNQLNELKEQQRGLFEQFKQQREQIKSAHEKLTDKRRSALKTEVKDLILDIQSSRNAIHTLRDQKHAAWEQFRIHAAAKQWDAAKTDMQTVVARKQDIIAKQKAILSTQQRIIERMNKLK